MIIAIDIGNTNSLIGVFEQNKLIKRFVITNQSKVDIDELKAQFLAQLKNISKVSAIVIASVVPKLTPIYDQLIFNIFQFRAVFLRDYLEKLPIKISLEKKEEVGDDRIANAIYVLDKYNQDAIVIDFGTAITFDLVTKEKGYQGGLILPSVKLAINSLAINTAQLPKIEFLQKPKNIIGTNTVSAINNGIYYGYISMIEGIISKIMMEYKKNFIIIATGGDGKIFAENIKEIKDYNQNLTLEGLFVFYKYLFLHKLYYDK